MSNGVKLTVQATVPELQYKVVTNIQNERKKKFQAVYYFSFALFDNSSA